MLQLPEERNTSGIGQRRSVRLPVSKVGHWHGTITLEEGIEVLAIDDLSTGGCGLVLEQWLSPGSVLSVTLAGSDGEPCQTELRVVYVTSRPEGGCLAGCQFQEPLSYDQLKGLLG